MWFNDLYKFIFSDFFVWLGSIILIITFTGGLKSMGAALFNFLDPYVRKKLRKDE